MACTVACYVKPDAVYQAGVPGERPSCGRHRMKAGDHYLACLENLTVAGDQLGVKSSLCDTFFRCRIFGRLCGGRATARFRTKL